MTCTLSRALTVGSAVAAVALTIGCQAEPQAEPLAAPDVPVAEAPAPETGKLESMGKQADAGIAAAGETIDEVGAVVEGAAAAAAAAGVELGEDVIAGTAEAVGGLKKTSAEAKGVVIEAASEIKQVSAEAAVELKAAGAEAAVAVAVAAQQLATQADEGLKQAGAALSTAAAAAKLSGIELGDDVEAKAEALIQGLKSGGANASDALAAQASELSRKLREESAKTEE